MRLGLIARCDASGLGYQTHAVYHWLQPAKTLVVDMSPVPSRRQRPPQHHGWYPHRARVAMFDGHEFDDPTIVDWLLEDVDVVFTCETPYRYDLYDQARACGVKTVAQLNPEFFRYGVEPDLPRPDVIVAPTSWRLDELRKHADVQVLPVPVDRTLFPPRFVTEARTFVHVGGMQAIQDRNGTQLVANALRHVRSSFRLRYFTQIDGPLLRANHRITIDTHTGTVDDRRALYDEGDVLLLPRRYGGLCLPMQEAASLGMPILTLDVHPQSEWLPQECRVPVQRSGLLRTQAGAIDVWQSNHRLMARAIDRMVGDPALVERLSKESDAWAESLSWEHWKPRYERLFTEVAAA